MPPGLYRSEEIHRLELERIFAKGWLCPGRAAEIPNAGDYLTYSIGAQPVFVIRDEDGEVKSFANVCLHRMMILLEGRGNVRRITCPYHAWSYRTDGKLVGAGHMQRTENFAKHEFCLPKIRTEVWKGWIYITLDPEAPSLAERLSPLVPLVDMYGMEDYRPVIQQDHVWHTIWKLVNENFMEGYHGPIVHRATVGAGTVAEESVFPNQVYDDFTYQTFTKPETAVYGVAHPDNRHLEGHRRRTSVLPTVFPAHMYSLAPDYLWYLTLRPDGPSRVKVRVGVALAPEVHAAQPDIDAYVAEMSAFFDKVNAEDRFVVEGIFRGAQAPLATGGPLSWMERELHDFKGYLARRLAS
jgi:phenylpropionate dioxygenase-like ring-hydroxylating dioxygenase large terminal subunit